MRNFIIAALVLFLLYSNSSFRTYTIEGLQSITNFIKELPKEDKSEEKKLEIDGGKSKEPGFSTY
tara:strand:- start:2081 stop:2275 length:195 start_codon:yes stop_codon:yes gene_type:complete